MTHELPPGPAAVPGARRAIEQLAPRLTQDQLCDLRLMVSELVTNGLRHGRDGPDDPLRLAVELAEDRARVEVVDAGSGFEVPRGGPRPREDAGWGLVLVDALSDRWGVEAEEPTRVWFELGLGGGRAPANAPLRHSATV